MTYSFVLVTFALSAPVDMPKLDSTKDRAILEDIGSDRKAKLVGTRLGIPKTGQSRAAVEKLIGPPDIPTHRRNYGAYRDQTWYHEEYYAYVKPRPNDRFSEGIHHFTVIYETIDGKDYFVKIVGPHLNKE